VLPGERLPEHDPDGPDVAARAGVLSAQPLRRDVRERAGDVADGGQRLRLVELREPEVEHPHREPLLVREEHVRRLHVPVHDPARVRVGEPLEDLRARFDRLAVAQRTGAQRLPQGAPAHVLVGDVDVAGVAAEAVGAQAALVSKPRSGLGLALGPQRRLSLARDDLERDVEPRPLVAGEPDGARAAAPERPQRPVAVEDELPVRECGQRGRHRVSALAVAARTPATASPGAGERPATAECRGTVDVLNPCISPHFAVSRRTGRQ